MHWVGERLDRSAIECLSLEGDGPLNFRLVAAQSCLVGAEIKRFHISDGRNCLFRSDVIN